MELEPIDLLSKTIFNVFSEDENDHEALNFLECFPIPDKELTHADEETHGTNPLKVKKRGASFEIQESEDLSKASKKRNKNSKN